MAAPKKKTAKKVSRARSKKQVVAGERVMWGVIIFTLLSIIFLLTVIMKYA